MKKHFKFMGILLASILLAVSLTGRGGGGGGTTGGGRNTLSIGDRPRGIFVLAGLGGASTEQSLSVVNQVIHLDYVEGVTIGFAWKDTETSPGRYDFSKVDAVMAVLQTTDKKLTIEVFAVDVPEWLWRNSLPKKPGNRTPQAGAP